MTTDPKDVQARLIDWEDCDWNRVIQLRKDAHSEITRLTAERDGWVETARLHSAAESSFLAWLRSAGEHMRAFGITICDDGSDAVEVLVAKVPECAKAMAARITDLETERDQALARAAAAAMEMRERAAQEIPTSFSYNHLSGRISALPIDPDAQKALNQMLAKAREDAIREAASVCSKISMRYWSEWKDEANMLSQGASDGADECDAAILALLNDGGRNE